MTRARRPDLNQASRETATAMVRRVLLAALPRGAEPSFREISSARFSGSSRNRSAIGELVMFNGLPATVEVFQAGEWQGIPFWGHRWLAMPGGACSLEADGWQRCDDDGSRLPHQPDLFTAVLSAPPPDPQRDRAYPEGDIL